MIIMYPCFNIDLRVSVPRRGFFEEKPAKSDKIPASMLKSFLSDNVHLTKGAKVSESPFGFFVSTESYKLRITYCDRSKKVFVSYEGFSQKHFIIDLTEG